MMVMTMMILRIMTGTTGADDGYYISSLCFNVFLSGQHLWHGVAGISLLTLVRFKVFTVRSKQSRHSRIINISSLNLWTAIMLHDLFLISSFLIPK